MTEGAGPGPGPSTDAGRWELVLEPGMFLVMQPNAVDPRAGIGVQTGELVVIRDHGAERLYELPTGLLLGQADRA